MSVPHLFIFFSSCNAIRENHKMLIFKFNWSKRPQKAKIIIKSVCVVNVNNKHFADSTLI